MTIDPEMLAAYADGELGPEDVALVEAAIAADPALAEEVAAHRALRTTLSAHFAPILNMPVPDRLTAALTPRDNVVNLAEVRKRKAQEDAPERPPLWKGWIMGGALAASLALGLVIGGQTDPGSDVITRDGQLMASGVLDKALTKQLASAQEGAAAQILVSFKAKDGRYCRGFAQGAMMGIACHTGNGWSIERSQAIGTKDAQGGYRQAGSAGRDLMAAAQNMAAGDALDAQGEKIARAAGWQP